MAAMGAAIFVDIDPINIFVLLYFCCNLNLLLHNCLFFASPILADRMKNKNNKNITVGTEHVQSAP